MYYKIEITRENLEAETIEFEMKKTDLDSKNVTNITFYVDS
tara:strand:- start:330 stop:452 length:123 start_codon:yes stop_codon:yes gene_type:complete